MWIHNESGELINTAHVRKFTVKQLTAVNNTATDSVVAQLHHGGEEVIIRHDPTGERSKLHSTFWCNRVISSIGQQMENVIEIGDLVAELYVVDPTADEDTGDGEDAPPTDTEDDAEPKDDDTATTPKSKRGKKSESVDSSDATASE